MDFPRSTVESSQHGGMSEEFVSALDREETIIQIVRNTVRTCVFFSEISTI